MTKTVGKVLYQLVAAMLVISLVNGSMATSICNTESSNMKLCLPAVKGMSPPPPTKQCCEVVRDAMLPCLCGYRNILPALGINPTHALTLPKKCGLGTPPKCKVG